MPAKRVGMSKKTRFEVFKRDGFRCQYCGASAPDVLLLVVDHIQPVAKGGKNNILNLITACQPCNAGKGARELSDNSVLEKQRDQLQELSERREQLEMMIQWKSGLCDLRASAVDGMASLWSKLVPGFSLSEHGRQGLKKLAGKHTVDEITEAMQTASEQYIELQDGKVTKESAEVAWKKVSGILRVRDLEKTKPYIKELFYIRGILRKRIYVNEWMALQLLEDAHLEGASLQSLRGLAKSCRNWTEFQADLRDYIDGARGAAA
jgi:hypothetical protein